VTTPRTQRRFIVTGAYGCIGAWVVRELLRRGEEVVAFDVGGSDHRLQHILEPEELKRLTCARGDITDAKEFLRTVDRYEITNIIHLAALQIPHCRSNPAIGARVNVEGTIAVFETARAAHSVIAPVVYASSVAVLAPNGSVVDPPATLYGVFKRANEGSAAVYWQDHGISSIGLRPHTVYGVGRDQGITSALTTAILCAVTKKRFIVPYGGVARLHYTEDVARAFVSASVARYEGASAHDIPGAVRSVREVVDLLEEAEPDARGLIEIRDNVTPIVAAGTDGASLAHLMDFSETPLRDGVIQTLERFRALAASGRLETPPRSMTGESTSP